MAAQVRPRNRESGRGRWWGLGASIGATAAMYAPAVWAVRRPEATGEEVLFATLLAGPLVLGVLLRTWWWPALCPLPCLAFAVVMLVVLRQLSDAYQAGEDVGLAPAGALVLAIFAVVGAAVLAGVAAAGVAVGKGLARNGGRARAADADEA